jgi:hypothetical protein
VVLEQERKTKGKERMVPLVACAYNHSYFEAEIRKTMVQG